jgi:hypothetical protein
MPRSKTMVPRPSEAMESQALQALDDVTALDATLLRLPGWEGYPEEAKLFLFRRSYMGTDDEVRLTFGTWGVTRPPEEPGPKWNVTYTSGSWEKKLYRWRKDLEGYAEASEMVHKGTFKIQEQVERLILLNHMPNAMRRLFELMEDDKAGVAYKALDTYFRIVGLLEGGTARVRPRPAPPRQNESDALVVVRTVEGPDGSVGREITVNG